MDVLRSRFSLKRWNFSTVIRSGPRSDAFRSLEKITTTNLTSCCKQRIPSKLDASVISGLWFDLGHEVLVIIGRIPETRAMKHSASEPASEAREVDTSEQTAIKNPYKVTAVPQQSIMRNSRYTRTDLIDSLETRAVCRERTPLNRVIGHGVPTSSPFLLLRAKKGRGKENQGSNLLLRAVVIFCRATRCRFVSWVEACDDEKPAD